MSEKRLKVELIGSAKELQHVLLEDFGKELCAINDALIAVDRKLVSKGKASAYYRIVNLSHSSPASVCIEPVPYQPDVDRGDQILNEFVNAWEIIKVKKRTPARFDAQLIERFRKIRSNPKAIPRIAVSIEGDTKRVEISDMQIEEFPARVKAAKEVLGSIKGHAVVLSFKPGHGRFELYPIVGPELVTCHYTDELIPEVERASNRWITVRGKMKYKEGCEFPTEIDVDAIEVHERDSELPTLSDLFGIAPNASGELKPEDFVRQLRDEN